jgi:hypothetical protein
MSQQARDVLPKDRNRVLACGTAYKDALHVSRLQEHLKQLPSDHVGVYLWIVAMNEDLRVGAGLNHALARWGADNTQCYVVVGREP